MFPYPFLPSFLLFFASFPDASFFALFLCPLFLFFFLSFSPPPCLLVSLGYLRLLSFTPQIALVVKNMPVSAGDIEAGVQSLGGKDPLEEGMANPSSILAWEIPGTEDSGGLWSIGSQRVRYNWSDIASWIYANPIWRTLSEGASPSLWHLPLVQSSKASLGGPSHCLLGVSRPCSSATSFYCTVNNGNQHLSTIPGLGVVGCLWNPQRYNPFSLYNCWPRLKQFYHIKSHIKTW